MLEEEVYGANSPIWDVEFAQNAVHGSASNGAGKYVDVLLKFCLNLYAATVCTAMRPLPCQSQLLPSRLQSCAKYILLLRKDTEQISMKFTGGIHYHEPIK